VGAWTAVLAHPRGALLVALVTVTALIRPSFISGGNLLNVLTENAPLGIVTCGVTWILISGSFDLSVGSVLSLVSVSVAVLLQAGVGTVPSVLLALGIGGLAGALNGILIGLIGANSVIVTLGGLAAYQGLAILVTGGEFVYPPAAGSSFLALGQGTILGAPVPAVVYLGLALVLQLVLTKTVLGRHVYAIGSRESAARLAGLRVPMYRFGLYVMSGVLVALAAIIITAWSDSGTYNMGLNYEFNAITAAVLGGVALTGATGSVARGAVLGVLILAMLSNAQTMLGVPPSVQLMTQGLILALIVASDAYRPRKRRMA